MTFLKARPLNIAIMISASWHLFFILTVSPIFNPCDIKNTSSRVAFLGSILKKVAPVPVKPFELDRLSFFQDIEKLRDNAVYPVTLSLPPITEKIAYSQPDKESAVFFSTKSIDVKSRRRKRERLLYSYSDTPVSGEARHRTLLYRPELLPIQIFNDSFVSDCNVGIRFKISRYGFVKRPECVISSGYPNLDKLAIRYLRRWQFVPREESLEEEGFVSIEIRTR